MCSNLFFRFVNIGFFLTFFLDVGRSLTKPFSSLSQAGPAAPVPGCLHWDC